GDLLPTRLVPPGAGATERAEEVLHVPRPPHCPDDQRHEEDRRAEADEEVLPPGKAGVEWFGVDHDALFLQQAPKRVGVCERWNLRAETRCRFGLAVAHGPG